VTGVPIKFLGTGEALDRLEPFRPDGLASRILGMGDIVGLVRDFEEVVDEKEAEEDAERLLRGKFGLEDLLKQLKTIQRMGPLREVFAKLPMFGSLAEQVDERELRKVEALIHSMTPAERLRPEIIDKRRASRIARGSGRRSREVRELVQRFDQMRERKAGRGRRRPRPARVGARRGTRPGAQPARGRSPTSAPEGEAQAGAQGPEEEPEALARALHETLWRERRGIARDPG
jgi:signal recognition particle GTPase